MKRIKPEEVKAAYKATGLRPERCRAYSTVDPDGPCACGVGAFAFRMHGGMGKDFWLTSFAMELLMNDGYSATYLSGFVDGFDGRNRHWCDADERMGAIDGAAAAALVFGEQPCT